MKPLLKLTTIASSLAASLILTSCGSMNLVSNKSKNTSTNSAYWKHKAKQYTVYSCHCFVATGLIEAEYYKVHGKRIDLSEADLFLKHIKRGAPNWDVAISRALARGVKSGNPRDLEIGYVEKSYKLIQKHGVAMESEFPYRSSTSIGIPLTMRILRTSIESIQKGLKKGKSQAELTAIEIQNIKKDGAYEIFQREAKNYPSRTSIRQFAQQYDLKHQAIYRKVDTQRIKELLKRGPVGLSYRVPHHKNPMLPTSSIHVVILVGYDTKKQSFISRNSDTKYIFGNQKLTDAFLRRFATNMYYLKKK